MAEVRGFAYDAASDEDAAAIEENRAHQRHMAILRVAKLAVKGQESFGLVRNISAGGMRIDVYIPLTVGQSLTISLIDGQQLSGTVVWQTENSVGVRFENVMPLDELLKPRERRRGKIVRAPRITVSKPARLRPAHGPASSVTLADLSQRGAKVEVHEGLQVHQTVTLEVAGLPPLQATVRWLRDGSAGLAFHGLIGARALMDCLIEDSARQSTIDAGTSSKG